jgi:FkbM family methyltransferase
MNNRYKNYCYLVVIYIVNVINKPWILGQLARGLKPSEIELKYIKKNFLPRDTVMILEAGMFDGSDSEEFIKTWPNCKIMGFEPIPSLFQQLVTKFQKNSNVEIYNLGLNGNERIKETSFYTTEGKYQSASSLLKFDSKNLTYSDLKLDKEIRIKCITLDEWFPKEPYFIDLMWLDIQGLELEVLKKGLTVLKFTKFLHIEVSLKKVYENSCTFDEINEFMNLQNFELIKVRIPNIMGNALYRNQNIAKTSQPNN